MVKHRHIVFLLKKIMTFGGDGNDTATGIQAGDSFIGGDGNDTAFLLELKIILFIKQPMPKLIL